MKKCLFLIVVFLLLASCSGEPKLEHQGAYIKENGKLTGLTPYFGIPEISNYQGVPVYDYTKPDIYLWIPDNRIDSFGISYVDKNKDIPISTITDRGGVIKITPSNEMEDGLYCLEIGDITRRFSDLLRWCFRIGDQKSIDATASALSEILDKKINVTPPGEGLYFVDDELNTSEIELIRLPTHFSNMTDYSQLPKTSNLKQVALLNSNDVNVDNFHLYRGRPLAGIGFEEGSSPCTSSGTGKYLRAGVKILAVNGKDITTCEEMVELIRAMSPMDEAALTIQEGTSIQTYNFILEGATFSDPTPIPISVKWGNGYIAIVPEQNLLPGLYCYSEKGWTVGYCFRVE